MKLIIYCISMWMPILLSLSDGVSSQLTSDNIQQQGRATQCREIGEYVSSYLLWDFFSRIFGILKCV